LRDVTRPGSSIHYWHCDKCETTFGGGDGPFSDRYDAAHPEEEHDGGLGSGDWLKEREA